TSSLTCSTPSSIPGFAMSSPGAAITAADVSVLAPNPAQASSRARFLQRLLRERKVAIGLVLLAILAFIAVFGSWMAPYHPDADDFGLLQPPSLEHPMGTDSFGRDLLSRLLVGTRVSFSVGFLAAAVALVVGGLLG